MTWRVIRYLGGRTVAGGAEVLDVGGEPRETRGNVILEAGAYTRPLLSST